MCDTLSIFLVFYVLRLISLVIPHHVDWMSVDVCLTSADVRWCPLTLADVSWRLLAFDDVRWRRLMSADVGWCQLTSADARWRPLMSADVGRRQLTSADVRWRLMTSAVRLHQSSVPLPMAERAHLGDGRWAGGQRASHHTAGTAAEGGTAADGRAGGGDPRANPHQVRDGGTSVLLKCEVSAVRTSVLLEYRSSIRYPWSL